MVAKTRSAIPRVPRVGFVSLGCPKALVDSESILTQLRAEGYDIAPSYEGSDLVVVNTCGFIDAAVEESLDAIGEALAANGWIRRVWWTFHSRAGMADRFRLSRSAIRKFVWKSRS